MGGIRTTPGKGTYFMVLGHLRRQEGLVFVVSYKDDTHFSPHSCCSCLSVLSWFEKTEYFFLSMEVKQADCQVKKINNIEKHNKKKKIPITQVC